MIFNEVFYINNQPPNDRLYIRQAGELKKDPSYSISRSNSQTHTLGFLKSGNLILEHNGKEYLIKEKQSLFLPQNLTYKISAEKNNPPHFFWINLRGTVIDALALSLFSNTFAVSSADISYHIMSLKNMISKNENMWEDISTLIFRTLIKTEKEKISASISKSAFSEYEYYISNSVQTGFSVEKMADFFHCSSETLNRQFKKKFSKTPYRCYRDMCIEIAKTMLCQTSLSIEDISDRLHFANRNHFSLQFKKATGYSPAAYKKSHLGK